MGTLKGQSRRNLGRVSWDLLMDVFCPRAATGEKAGASGCGIPRPSASLSKFVARSLKAYGSCNRGNRAERRRGHLPCLARQHVALLHRDRNKRPSCSHEGVLLFGIPQMLNLH